MDAHRSVVAARGLTFSTLEWGSGGQTVLLLHGFPQTATSWAAVAPVLAAGGLRVVALDQRGYSPGARPRAVGDYATPELVADVVAVIGALGGPVHLVGHDWGGVVGWQVAARHPDLVRTWTAVSTPNQLALNEVLADPAERERFAYMVRFRQPGAEDALLADDAAGLRSFFGGDLTPAREDADVAVMREPGALTAALNWYRAMNRADSADLGLVTVPTSYVWGSDDLAFGRAAAERTAAFVDAPYEFVPLEGASHWLPDTEPGVVADTVLRRVRYP